MLIFFISLLTPEWYNLEDIAPKHDLISRKLSLPVNWANAITINCSQQVKERTR